MEPISLTLSGRIYRDPESDTGMYVSVIAEWDLATCGRTVDEAIEMTWHLIDDHLEACRQLGTLNQVLGKLGAPAVSDVSQLHVRATLAVEGEHDVILAKRAAR